MSSVEGGFSFDFGVTATTVVCGAGMGGGIGVGFEQAFFERGRIDSNGFR